MPTEVNRSTKSTALQLCRFVVGFLLAASAVSACSSQSDAQATTTSSSSIVAKAPITGQIGVPVYVEWAGPFTGTGSITVNSFIWMTNPAYPNSTAIRLVANVTAKVDSGVGDVDPNYWTAYGPNETSGVNAGVETSFFADGMVAVPIKEGAESTGVIAWDTQRSEPIRITISGGVTADITWMFQSDALDGNSRPSQPESAQIKTSGSGQNSSSTTAVAETADVAQSDTVAPGEFTPDDSGLAVDGENAATGSSAPAVADAGAFYAPREPLDGSTVDTVATQFGCSPAVAIDQSELRALAAAECDLAGLKVQVLQFDARSSAVSLLASSDLGIQKDQYIWFGNFLIIPSDISLIVPVFAALS